MARTRSSARTDAVCGKIRCAIYTRKSTEEGLEQEFNSLDAQREACAAYILSQRHEGWQLLPDLYDDGGYSGGSLDRPGLQQLLADVAAGKVDVIVVYKVDRLTRSLADFAKIVEVLDAKGASFVSVTQAFNTTTSMGRLTLNVLLSFAQFEREVTGERIRDKIAASKKKGLWMGGPVPLGYDVRDRKLIINEAEADQVRFIFERYVDLGSTGALADELAQRGIRTKRRVFANGQVQGDARYTRGALAHLLQNRIYIGEIVHKGEAYPGEHAAIVSQELWDAAQALMADHRRARQTGTNAQQLSLLAGMICDGHGRPMTPSHAKKGAQRYRYYVSRSNSDSDHRPWRLPAGEIEALVIRRTADLLGDHSRLAQEIGGGLSADQLDRLLSRARETGLRIASLAASDQRQLLQQLGLAVHLHDDRIEFDIRASELIGMLLEEDQPHQTDTGERIGLTIPVQLKRRGVELRLVFPASDRNMPVRQDAKLIGLIIKAHAAWGALGRAANSDRAAAGRNHLMRLARLRWLAPDIISAILDGRQPANLTARQLLRAANIPFCWQEQRVMFGFG